MITAATHLLASAHKSGDDSGLFDSLLAVFGTVFLSGLGWLGRKLVNGANDMHKMLIILVGKEPDKFDPEGDEGMIKTVAAHSKQLVSQDKKLDALMKASRANLTEGSTFGPETRAAVRTLDETQRTEST